jgi:hypothetical protein
MNGRGVPLFPPHTGFHAALRGAVDNELAAVEPRDSVALYVKIAVVVAGTRACYTA